MIARSGVRLGDLAQFKYGNMPDTEMVMAFADENHPYPAYSGYRIVGYYPRYNYLEPTLIIVCRGVGGTGDVKISPPKCWLTNLSISFRFTDNQVSPKYLYYLFKVYSLRFLDTGSAQSQITIADLKRLKIDLPSYPTQRKIAAILTAYDDLIEVNKRRIALLETMAEELYREWFVRMHFPGHQNTKFVKGVPVGWELNRIDSLGEIITGKTPPTSNVRNYNGDYPFIKTPDMHGTLFILETAETLSEDGVKSQPSQTIPEGSLCVSCIGTGGVVSITTKASQTNQQINSIKLNRKQDLEWGFFLLQGLKEMIYLFGSTGTTMTNLSKGKFSALKFFLPPTELRDEFHLIAEPVFSQIRFLVSANQTLTRTRDLLLPRLISGKLSVEDLDIQFPPNMRKENPL